MLLICCLAEQNLAKELQALNCCYKNFAHVHNKVNSSASGRPEGISESLK